MTNPWILCSLLCPIVELFQCRIPDLYPTFSCKTPTRSFAKSKHISLVIYIIFKCLYLKSFHPIAYSFRTYSNKETQSKDPIYSALFPTKEAQSNSTKKILRRCPVTQNSFFVGLLCVSFVGKSAE